jgi:hypothetical protein
MCIATYMLLLACRYLCVATCMSLLVCFTCVLLLDHLNIYLQWISMYIATSVYFVYVIYEFINFCVLAAVKPANLQIK